MQWYIIYGKEMNYLHEFWITRNWGLVLFIAGATGGMTAGWISDKVFGSRRAPVAALFYALMLVAVAAMTFSLDSRWVLGLCVFVISYCVIGTHGMLSGTATMDFGGRKNAGTAVGLIDGMVYFGNGHPSGFAGKAHDEELVAVAGLPAAFRGDRPAVRHQDLARDADAGEAEG